MNNREFNFSQEIRLQRLKLSNNSCEKCGIKEKLYETPSVCIVCNIDYGVSLKRLSYVCQRCRKIHNFDGKDKKVPHIEEIEIQIHHLIPHHFIKEYNNILGSIGTQLENTMALCLECHKEANEIQAEMNLFDFAILAWAIFDLNVEFFINKEEIEKLKIKSKKNRKNKKK